MDSDISSTLCSEITDLATFTEEINQDDTYDMPDTTSSEVIRREKPQDDGLYILGSVENVKVTFTTDTGATRTLISDRVYRSIPVERRPPIQKTKNSKLTGACGTQLKECGKAIFNIELGDVQFEHELIVAEISDEGLLGMDILQNSPEGPADILLSQGVIKWQGIDIPGIQVGLPEQVMKVTVERDYHIPEYCEAVIDVSIEASQEGADTNTELLIGPSTQFAERNSLVVAHHLIDASNPNSIKIRVMNPYSTSAVIKKNEVIGEAEKVDVLLKLADMENEDDMTEYSEIRRIQIEPNGPTTNRNVSIVEEKEVDVINDVGNSIELPDHMIELYEKSIPGRSPEEQEVIKATLYKYRDTFSKDENDLGQTHLIEHAIDTGDARPIKQPPRRVPIALAEDERKAIEQMKQQGVIRESQSPWSSPIVLVRKKNGKVRPCIDFRRVNEVTKKDAFPLPRIQDCLDAVSGAKLFSTFDLTSGYFQIPVKSEDIPKTAFVTKYGLYEFTSMPFGLCNSAATFQRVMEIALSGLQWLTCLIYIDDIIVFGNDVKQHMQRVDEVLNRIAKAGLKLKPEKCDLLCEEVRFLGHVINENGVMPDPTNISKIMDCPPPKTVSEVRQFLGMGSYYRRFIQNFSEIVKQMVHLTKKNVPFVWSAECDNAFQKLKEALVSTDIMAYPKDEGQFILDTDASDNAIGAVLSQIQDGTERVIAYGSRTMNKAEKNYCVTDKELLAIRYFTEYYRQYLLGRTFMVRTDHQALVWLFRLKEPKGRIARWIEVLSSYDFSISYRQGTKHQNADTMSRICNPRACVCEEEAEQLKCGPCKKCIRKTETMCGYIDSRECSDDKSESQTERVQKVGTRSSLLAQPLTNFGVYKTEELARLQNGDETLKQVIKWVKENYKPDYKEIVTQRPELRHYWHIWSSMQLINDVLYKKYYKKDGTAHYLQLMVPEIMRSEVLRHTHDNFFGGHLGQKKTRKKTQQRFYWFEMREDVNIWVSKCDVCARNKQPNQNPRGSMGDMRTGAPMDRIAADLIGPLPETPRGNKFILVVTDHFSKWAEAFPVQNQSASTCANFIAKEIVSRFGCPLTIHTDQGGCFESDIFKSLCEIFEIKKTRTSARNPKCNGVVERYNKTLVKMIKSYISDDQSEWDLYLPFLTAAYRATPQDSSQLTPNLLMLGRETRQPVDLAYLTPDTENLTPGSYADKLRHKTQHAHEVARKHLAVAHRRQKDNYNNKLCEYSYESGDAVWMLNETRKVGVNQKLQPTYIGPIVVLQKLDNLLYRVQIDARGQQRIVNHNKMKPYKGDNYPPWGKAALAKFRRHVNACGSDD